MNMLEIFKDHYKDLSQEERDIITTTDLATAEAMTFDTLEDFQDFAKEVTA